MIRAITAIIMGVLIIAAVWWLPKQGFDVMVLAMVLLGLVEYSKMFFKDKFHSASLVAAGGILAFAMIFGGSDSQTVLMLLPVALFILAIVFMWRAPELAGIADKLGIAVLGLLYLGIAFPFWGLLRSVEFGRAFVLMALVPACLCDTFAFIAGKTLGRHKFAPMVSPNKTIEGFIGALVGSLVGTFAVRSILLPFIPWYYTVAFALVIWIVSPFGDLIESMLKRSCGVKDSGSIIPGHGGILDRLDALIFTGPAAYIFVSTLVL